MSDSSRMLATPLTDSILSIIRSGKPGQLVHSASGADGGLRFVAATTADGRFSGGYVACERRLPGVRLHLSLVLDVSASMMERAPGTSQTKLDVALDCIKEICRSPFMAKEDMLTVFTFSKTVHLAWEVPIQDFDHETLKDMVNRTTKGSTAARDGVLEALRHLQRPPRGTTYTTYHNTAALASDKICYILALTDGEDNASVVSVNRLVQEVNLKMQQLGKPQLGKPQLQLGNSQCFLKVIAAGLGARDRSDWTRICNLPGCELLEIQQASDLDLREAFNKALVHMRQLIVRDNTTHEVHQITYAGDLEAANEMDLQVTAMMSSLLITNMAPATGHLCAPRGIKFR